MSHLIDIVGPRIDPYRQPGRGLLTGARWPEGTERRGGPGLTIRAGLASLARPFLRASLHVRFALARIERTRRDRARRAAATAVLTAGTKGDTEAAVLRMEAAEAAWRVAEKGYWRARNRVEAMSDGR
jgi:hypothetical protein